MGRFLPSGRRRCSSAPACRGLLLHRRRRVGRRRAWARGPGRVQRDEEAGPAGRAGQHGAVRVRVEEGLEPAAGGAADDGVAVRPPRGRAGQHAERLPRVPGRRERELGGGCGGGVWRRRELELEEAEATMGEVGVQGGVGVGGGGEVGDGRQRELEDAGDARLRQSLRNRAFEEDVAIRVCGSAWLPNLLYGKDEIAGKAQLKISEATVSDRIFFRAVNHVK